MSGKRPTDHMEPSAKKRGNERQLTKDDESDGEEVVDPGNFARASEEVLKQRKIVRARRGGGTAAVGEQPKAANPFAGIQLAAGGAAPSGNPFGGVSLFGTGGGATPAPTPTKPDVGAAAEAAPASHSAHPATAGEQPADEGQQAVAPAPAANQDDVSQQEEGKQGGERDGKEAAAAEAKPPEEKPASTTAAAAASSGFGAFGGTKGGLAFGSSTSSGGLAFGSAGGGFGSAGGGFGSLASAGSSSAFSFNAASAATTTSSIFTFSAASSSAAAGTGDAPASVAAGAAAEAAASAPAVLGSSGTSLFGATPASGTPLFGAAPPAAAKVELPEEAAVTTGEEDERTVFSGEGALFEFDAAKQWRERGRGEMRVNVASSGQARLVMRQKGNLRLLMNANLWTEMQVSKMEGGKGVTFACINAAGPGEETSKEGTEGEAAGPAGSSEPTAAAPKLATFALRIKPQDVLEQFVAAVNTHKAGGRKAPAEGAA